MTDEIYQCPVCGADTPIDQLFLKQDQGTSIQPIICVGCVTGFYYVINNPKPKGEEN